MKKLDVPQSGSQADTVASRNRFGQYNRTRATPVQPRTSRQLAVRGYLIDASQAWRDLTDEERASWSTWAATQPKSDSLGQTVFLTGHQAWVSLWVALANAGLAVPPDVPTETPPAPPVIASVTALDDGTLEASLDNPTPEDVAALCEVSGQVSAGVSFNGDYRFILSEQDWAGGTFDLAAEYVARFGALILGRKIFLRFRYITAAGGLSAPSTISVIVTAAPP